MDEREGNLWFREMETEIIDFSVSYLYFMNIIHA